MADLTPGEAMIEGEVLVRVRGRLRRVFSTAGHWYAQVRFASNASEYGYKVEVVPLSEVEITPPDAQHRAMDPPPDAL